MAFRIPFLCRHFPCVLSSLVFFFAEGPVSFPHPQSLPAEIPNISKSLLRATPFGHILPYYLPRVEDDGGVLVITLLFGLSSP